MRYYVGEIKTQATEIHEIYDKVIFKTDDPNPEKIFRLSIQFWVNYSLEVEDGFENSDDDYIGTDGFGASYFAEWFDEISKKAFEELQEVGSDYVEITEKDLETLSVINDYDDKLFRVAIVMEEGTVVQVRAKNPEDAKEKAYELAGEWGGSEYPKVYKHKCVHRDYFTQDAEEIEG